MDEALALAAIWWERASGRLLQTLDDSRFSCPIVTHNQSQRTAQLQNLLDVGVETSDTRNEKLFDGSHPFRYLQDAN
jgi:hypothetical protein